MPVASAMRSVLPRRALSAFDFRADTSRAALAAAFLPPSNRPARGFWKFSKGPFMPSWGRMPKTAMTRMKAAMRPMKALMILLFTESPRGGSRCAKAPPGVR